MLRIVEKIVLPFDVWAIVAWNGMTGSYCGYISLPRRHPWWGLHWDAPELAELPISHGITFSEFVNNDQLDELSGWVLGFDCIQSEDAPSPRWLKNNPEFAGIYKDRVFRDLPEVWAETLQLAAAALQVNPSWLDGHPYLGGGPVEALLHRSRK